MNDMDLALCNALAAVQDTLTFDVFGQAEAIRDVCRSTSIKEISETLDDWDVKGCDLLRPVDLQTYGRSRMFASMNGQAPGYTPSAHALPNNAGFSLFHTNQIQG